MVFEDASARSRYTVMHETPHSLAISEAFLFSASMEVVLDPVHVHPHVEVPGEGAHAVDDVLGHLQALGGGEVVQSVLEALERRRGRRPPPVRARAYGGRPGPRPGRAAGR